MGGDGVLGRRLPDGCRDRDVHGRGTNRRRVPGGKAALRGSSAREWDMHFPSSVADSMGISPASVMWQSFFGRVDFTCEVAACNSNTSLVFHPRRGH